MAETPARKRQLSALTSIILLLIPTAVGKLINTLNTANKKKKNTNIEPNTDDLFSGT